MKKINKKIKRKIRNRKKLKSVNPKIKIFSYDEIKDKKFRPTLEKLNIDLLLVFAFGHIISEELLNVAKHGSFNIHTSLLPKYRGAAPIQRSIINCDRETGITFNNRTYRFKTLGFNKNFYKDKKIIIFGGGDSALDWTVELSKIASHVTLVHRRDEFKAANHTVNLMKQLVKEGQVDLITKNQISDVKGSDRVEKAIIKDNDGNEKIIDCDEILIFYGLKMELGPINDWGLNLNEKQIEVNTENFETNLSGVFAMGDISYYPGKLKLILSGFHEAALAAQKAFIRARPDETLTFRYTTSSSDIQKKLGVK